MGRPRRSIVVYSVVMKRSKTFWTSAGSVAVIGRSQPRPRPRVGAPTTPGPRADRPHQRPERRGWHGSRERCPPGAERPKTQADQGRRERRVLGTRATEDAEL